MYVDLIVVLEKGEIVETGTHAELIARGGRYAYLYGLQFRESQRLESMELAVDCVEVS